LATRLRAPEGAPDAAAAGGGGLEDPTPLTTGGAAPTTGDVAAGNESDDPPAGGVDGTSAGAVTAAASEAPGVAWSNDCCVESDPLSGSLRTTRSTGPAGRMAIASEPSDARLETKDGRTRGAVDREGREGQCSRAVYRVG